MVKYLLTYRPERRQDPDRPGTVVETVPLEELDGLAVQAGDEAVLLAGTYWSPYTVADPVSLATTARAIELKGLRGTPDAPIVIRGVGPRTRLVGANWSVPLYPDLPTAEHYAFFRLIDCEHVIIADCSVESCWPTFLYTEGCRHITMRNVSARDGLFLMFARGLPNAPTSHLLVEDCSWQQDPTGAVWTTHMWEAVHHEELRFYNGALVGGVEVSGNVVVRNNVCTDAYNGVRFVARNHTHNVDFEISGNRFERIRDNCVEPEAHALNWWIVGNDIVDAHAPFSFDGVEGGWRHIMGNTMHFESRPGEPHDPNTGGKVLKFDKTVMAGDAERPSVVAHNSFHVRSFFAKKSAVAGLSVRANAIVYCQGGADENTCPQRTTMTNGFYEGVAWPDTVSFDYDHTTFAFRDGTKGLPAAQEPNGRDKADIRFKDPAAGDFALVGDPLATPPFVLSGGVEWASPDDSAVVDEPGQAGAVMADGTRWRPPPFLAVGDGLARIVRVDRGPEEVVMYASHPAPPGADVTATIAGNPAAVAIDGRRIAIAAGASLPHDAPITILTSGAAWLSAFALPDPLVSLGAAPAVG